MAPKKAATKMSLNEFLGDSTLGSWSDHMDSLPTAPAPRTDEERSRRDYGGGGRFDSADRQSQYPPRQELPLPTAPPYTGFVGNLAFDIREGDIEDFFKTSLKSIKIISDRDGKPKGFGYVEFETLQGLKDGLAKSGGQLAGRTVRVSVAEPPKERAGYEDEKFGASSWRRDGPLPSSDRGPDRGGPRSGAPSSRYDDGADRGERMGMGSRFTPSAGGPERTPRMGSSRLSDAPPGEADNTNDWRSTTRPMRAPPASDRPGPPSRKSSSFSPTDGPAHAADTEETWAIGSKFKASDPAPPPSKKSDFFGRSARPAGDDEPSDWRSAPRKAPTGPQPPRSAGFDRSPDGSAPSTPRLGRRNLELTRSGNPSADPSPIASPKAASAVPRSNPFGDAKPVDVAAREKEIEEKLAQDKGSRLTDKSNEPLGAGREKREFGGGFGKSPTTETSSWRDPSAKRTPTAFSNGRASATHSRTTSVETANARSATAPAARHRPQFSFAAAAAAAGGVVHVAEGEDDEDEAKDQSSENAEQVKELQDKLAEVAV